MYLQWKEDRRSINCFNNDITIELIMNSLISIIIYLKAIKQDLNMTLLSFSA